MYFSTQFTKTSKIFIKYQNNYLPSKAKKCKIKAQKGSNDMSYKRASFALM